MYTLLIGFRNDESIIIYGKVEKKSNGVNYDGYVVDSNCKKIEVGRFVQYSIDEYVVENAITGDRIALTHYTMDYIEVIEEDDFCKIKVLSIKKRNWLARMNSISHFIMELKIDDEVKKIPCWANIVQPNKDNLIHDIKRTLEINDTLYYFEDFKFEFGQE